MDTYRHPPFKATHKHEVIPKLSLAYEFTGVGSCMHRKRPHLVRTTFPCEWTTPATTWVRLYLRNVKLPILQHTTCLLPLWYWRTFSPEVRMTCREVMDLMACLSLLDHSPALEGSLHSYMIPMPIMSMGGPATWFVHRIDSYHTNS